MPYTVIIERSAVRMIQRFPDAIRGRVDTHIRALA